MKVYHSEAAKFRELDAMKYVTGGIADVGAGSDKITPDAFAYDGRPVEGVDQIQTGLKELFIGDIKPEYDTIFSSHFLEHVTDPDDYILSWSEFLVSGGHLVLYLPEKSHYDSHQNPEHMFNWSYEDFMFFFKRAFCGEGKDFKGEYLPKLFEVVDSGFDIRENCYSFYLVAKKL